MTLLAVSQLLPLYVQVQLPVELWKVTWSRGRGETKREKLWIVSTSTLAGCPFISPWKVFFFLLLPFSFVFGVLSSPLTEVRSELSSFLLSYCLRPTGFRALTYVVQHKRHSYRLLEKERGGQITVYWCCRLFSSFQTSTFFKLLLQLPTHSPALFLSAEISFSLCFWFHPASRVCTSQLNEMRCFSRHVVKWNQLACPCILKDGEQERWRSRWRIKLVWSSCGNVPVE